MSMFRPFLFVILGLLPSLASAVELTLPGSARQTAGQNLGVDSYALPIAKFDGTDIPSRIFEGFVTRQAWRIEGGGGDAVAAFTAAQGRVERERLHVDL